MKKIITGFTLSTFSLLIGCAAPPLQYYTLTEGGLPKSANTIHYSDNATLVYISRITVPDYLNTSDITIRDQAKLNYSINGRMSSILSIGMTELITNILSDKNPNLWITHEAPVTPPTYQLMINITRFDLQQKANEIGQLSLEATWSLIPKDTTIPLQKRRTSFVIKGSIKTDSDIIKLEQNAINQLSISINNDVGQLHSF